MIALLIHTGAIRTSLVKSTSWLSADLAGAARENLQVECEQALQDQYRRSDGACAEATLAPERLVDPENSREHFLAH